MDFPWAVWILAGLAVLAVLAAFVMTVRKMGAKKYGMSFFKSIPFALLILGAVFFGSVFIIVHLFPNVDAVNYEIAKGTSVLSILAALALNVRRSKPAFGALYTLAQAVAAYSFVLALLGFIVVRKIDD